MQSKRVLDARGDCWTISSCISYALIRMDFYSLGADYKGKIMNVYSGVDILNGLC